LESDRTPRFRVDEKGDKVTVGIMERVGFSIFESCLGRPTRKNSVSEGLRLRDFSNCIFEKRNIFREFVRRERNEKLSVVSVQMVMNRKCTDDGT
jgi:hypothetical protein